MTEFDLARCPTHEVDVLVAGSGIAGLYTALKLQDRVQVLVITKDRLEESNTDYAQGGIAAAIGSEDSPRLHLQDTLAASDGLCLEEAVGALVEEGPACVLELVTLGTEFDRSGDELALGREAAHSRPRVLHARGDATGYEIRRALQAQVMARGIPVLERYYLVDVLVYDGRCYGVLALAPDGRLHAFLARAVVLATGGAGHLYTNTTNPEVATGDGVAVAYRAGAEIADVEFVQFHPTSLHGEGNPKFLISEAVRGEGAQLIGSDGQRFMPAYHALAELAPRDVVARAIVQEMNRTGSPYVWLDATGLPAVAERFPRISAECLRRGIDITRDPIPVAPAAHYMMGGVRVDLWGRTLVPGLYACGEAACTGIHGANRLASNSLLEGLVFGRRIAACLGEEVPATRIPAAVRRLRAPARPEWTLPVQQYWHAIQVLMWDHLGIVREGPGLAAAESQLAAMMQELSAAGPREVQALQLVNLATVAWLVAQAARARTESRGAHYRTDYPARDDAVWRKHIVQHISRGLFVEG